MPTPNKAKDNKHVPADLNKLIHRTSTFLEILESGPKEERERFASPKRLQAHFQECQQAVDDSNKKINRLNTLSSKIRRSSPTKTFQRPKTSAQILSEALAPKPPKGKEIKEIIFSNMHDDKYSPAKHWRTENKDNFKKSRLMLSL